MPINYTRQDKHCVAGTPLHKGMAQKGYFKLKFPYCTRQCSGSLLAIILSRRLTPQQKHVPGLIKNNAPHADKCKFECMHASMWYNEVSLWIAGKKKECRPGPGTYYLCMCIVSFRHRIGNKLIKASMR